MGHQRLICEVFGWICEDVASPHGFLHRDARPEVSTSPTPEDQVPGEAAMLESHCLAVPLSSRIGMCQQWGARGLGVKLYSWRPAGECGLVYLAAGG